MAEPVTAVIVLNAATLVGVIRVFVKVGAMEKMFQLMWIDFARRKKLE